MAEYVETDISTSSTKIESKPMLENYSCNKTAPVVKSGAVKALTVNDKNTVQKYSEKTNMNDSISIEEEDTSSSDLKWDTMSITSMQSGMTQFDTIEDVSYAIGKK